MNQGIIAAFVSLVQHFDKLSSYKVSLRMKRYGHNKGGVTDFIPAETSPRYPTDLCVCKRKLPQELQCRDGFASSLPTNRHDSPPPRCVKLLQSHSHFMGRGGASWEDVSISVMVMPGSAGARAHSGS